MLDLTRAILENVLRLLMLLVLVAAGVSGWLLGTSSGARYLLDLARDKGGLDLNVAGVQGRLIDNLELSGLTLRTESLDVQLDRVVLIWSPLALLRGSVQIQSLRAGEVRLLLHAQEPEPKPEPFKLPDMIFNIAVRDAAVNALHWTSGTSAPQELRELLVRDFTWSGDEVRIEKLALRHAETGPLQAQAVLQLAPDQVRIEQLDIREAGGDTPIVLHLQGLLAWGPAPSDLKLRWEHLRWPLRDTARIASTSGTLDIEGRPEAYRYALEAMLAAEKSAGKVQVRGAGDRQGTDLALDKARAQGQASIRWDPALSLDGKLEVRDLDPGVFAPEWPGRLNGSLRARADLSGAAPRTKFEIELAQSRLRAYPLQLSARGELAGERLRLERMHLLTGKTRLEVAGQVTPPFDAQATLDSPDLAALYPLLRGRAQLSASLKGSVDAPRITARGSGSGLGFEEYELARLDLDADLDLARVSSRPSSLRLTVAGLKGPVKLTQAEVKLGGRMQDHRLDISAAGEPGKIALGFAGTADREALSWRGRLVSGQLTPPDFAAWSLEAPAALRASRQTVDLEPACWRAGKARVCAQGSRTPARARAAFRLERLDFAYFESFLPTSWRASGQIDGTGLVELVGGRLSEARADLKTTPIQLRFEDETLLATQAGSLKVQELQGVTTAQLSLPLKAGYVRATAELRANADPGARPLRANVDLRLEELGFLRGLSAEILEISGLVQGRVNWSGTLAAPIPQGAIRLQNAEVKLAKPGIALSAMSAELATAGRGLWNVKAQATSGEGTLRLSGRIDPLSAKPGAQLALVGKDFQAADIPDVRAWISPDLRIAWSENRIDVTGNVDVPRADITPVSRNEGIAPSADQVIVKPEDTVRETVTTQLAADVRINLGKRVNFEGFGLTTKLTGSVRAIDEPDRRQTGRGEVRLIDGRYEAYGQDLEIESGRLLFNGGPLTEPALEIRAVRRPRDDVEVGVMVRGTLDRPEFTLQSTPAMPREEQLSWLVLGRPLEQAGGADERAMIANAALALGLTGTNVLAGRLTERLRLDELSIASEPGEDAEAARVTFGKYLSPRIFVSYGVGLFQPGQVFKLLYDLGRGFKLQTESGVNSGGDLLYSIERP